MATSRLPLILSRSHPPRWIPARLPSPFNLQHHPPRPVGSPYGLAKAERPAENETDAKEQYEAKREAKVARTYKGVVLPVKPTPPEEGDCCQSGCAHCTYDIYAEDVLQFHELLATAKVRALELRRRDGGDGHDTWPHEFGSPEGGTASAKEEADKAVQEQLQSLDPGMRAFLELEAKLKKKT